MKRFTLNVTEEHIQRGVPRSKRRLVRERCPVELAAAEQLIGLRPKQGEYVLEFYVDADDPSAYQFVEDFDDGKPVSPRSIKILVPETEEEERTFALRRSSRR